MSALWAACCRKFSYMLTAVGDMYFLLRISVGKYTALVTPRRRTKGWLGNKFMTGFFLYMINRIEYCKSTANYEIYKLIGSWLMQTQNLWSCCMYMCRAVGMYIYTYKTWYFSVAQNPNSTGQIAFNNNIASPVRYFYTWLSLPRSKPLST